MNISGHTASFKIGVSKVQDFRNFELSPILTADPGVTSLIPAQSHISVEIHHGIISTAILLLSADSRSVVVSYKRKYVHEALVNCLVKLAQEKVWLCELTIPT